MTLHFYNITMGIFSGIKKAIDERINYRGGSFYSLLSSGISPKNKTELLHQYKNLVYACVNVISEEVGKYEPIFLDGDKELNHPFKRVLNRPNPHTSKFDLFFASQAYLELTGELYWYIPKGEFTKQIREIYILRPDKMKFALDNDEKVVGYVYMRGDGTQIPFELDEVETYFQFNPLSETIGYSTVQAGSLYIDGENDTSEFQNAFIRNQATPSGIISIKNKMTKELFDKLKRQWKMEHAGARNAGKTVFLNGGDVEFTKMGLSISDINLKELKEVTEKKVLQMFRVPSALLGETDSNGLGRANIDTIEYIFSKRTIEPKLVRLDDFIERIIRNHYKENVIVNHESLIPEDLEFRLKLMESGKDIWLTRNEIRQLSGFNLKDVEGGDKLYINLSQVAINEKPEVQRTFKVKVRDIKKKIGENLYQDLQLSENKHSKQIQRTLKKLVKEQEKLVLEKIPLLSKKVKAFEEFLIDLDTMTPEMVLALFPEMIETLTAGGEIVVSFSGLDIQFLISQAERDAVFSSTERLMKSFNKETVEKIQKQLAGGLMNNESQAELAKRVESIFSEAKGYRAERIARTEAHKATNQGVAMAYQQQGYKEMRWVAWGDACEFCASMNGKTVSIGKPFVSKGETLTVGENSFLADYDDVRYADLHPNCRCKIEPV